MKKRFVLLLLASSFIHASASEFMEFGNKGFKEEKLKENQESLFNKIEVEMASIKKNLR